MATTEVNSRDWVALEHQYYQGTFKRQPVTFVRGEGPRVWDSDGKVYLDLVAGIAVNVLGHCHPAIVKAVQHQVKQLIHVSNLYWNEQQIICARHIARRAHAMGSPRVFFCNSGAEANEAALKLARRWGHDRGAGRFEVVSTLGSFHGRTFGTLSATGQEKYHIGFQPLVPGFRPVAPRARAGGLQFLARTGGKRSCATAGGEIKRLGEGFPGTGTKTVPAQCRAQLDQRMRALKHSRRIVKGGHGFT